jgi:hypothetical protein
MKKYVFLLSAYFSLFSANHSIVLHAQSKHWGIPYSVAAVPWEERIEDKNPRSHSTDYRPFSPNRLGKHRAIITVPSQGRAASLDFEWRLHDKNMARHWLFIINKETGDTVKNIFRRKFNNEQCSIIFGPVEKGDYYFYYLPYYILESTGAYGTGDPWEYTGTQPPADSAWLAETHAAGNTTDTFVQAKCVEIQSKTAFDSFYPMEIVATAHEKDLLRMSSKGKNFLVFPEDRKYPIRMLDDIPQRWVQRGTMNSFTGTAARNEYYAFQLGVWTFDSIAQVRIEFAPLKGRKYVLPVRSMTCFNTGGINAYGKQFSKTVNLSAGKVQPLWIGLDVPDNIPPDTYQGTFVVRTGNAGAQSIDVHFTVTKETIADRGDGEPWRHSRLRRLNSTLGIDEEPVKPYQPIAASGDRLTLSGKEVELSGTGLPKSISVFGEEILAAPMEFSVDAGRGPLKWEAGGSTVVKSSRNCYAKEWVQKNPLVRMTTQAEVESDGWIKYIVTIKADQDVNIDDIRLTIPYRAESSQLMSGMDRYGMPTPETHAAKWDSLFDAFWFGSPTAGLYCELRGTPYSGPMMYWPPIREFYKLKPPESWYNRNQGGYRIRTTGERRDVTVYSGARSLKKGDSLAFECAFIITPVKKLDTHYQLSNRYYHNSTHPEPGPDAERFGIKAVNLHHGNSFNQYINYPYSSHKQMRDFVERCHEKGTKVKIYYTTRELTSMAAEIWAFRSLGDEILTGGPGGGCEWLKEHFCDGYAYNWYIIYGDLLPADAAVQTAVGANRFYNYYIEDLRWLAAHVGMDGLYIDAAAYDRETVKRIKKAIMAVRPECLLDLHEGQNSILRYLEFFPYLDKIWFGEGVDYEGSSPATWLTSISGIPFGFIGDMLHLGGNPWKGMVYGMAPRFGWESYGIKLDPTHIWSAMDDFGIADARMVGYWDKNPVVVTSDSSVKATAYVKAQKMLISVASWAKEPRDVRLRLDLRAAGLTEDSLAINAPAILNFQPAREFKPNASIRVDPGKGWLLLVKKK